MDMYPLFFPMSWPTQLSLSMQWPSRLQGRLRRLIPNLGPRLRRLLLNGCCPAVATPSSFHYKTPRAAPPLPYPLLPRFVRIRSEKMANGKLIFFLPGRPGAPADPLPSMHCQGGDLRFTSFITWLQSKPICANCPYSVEFITPI